MCKLRGSVRAVIKGHRANVCAESNVCRTCVCIYIYGESTWAEEEKGGKTSFFFLFATFDFEEDEVKWS